jgi:hypothetical protein
MRTTKKDYGKVLVFAVLLPFAFVCAFQFVGSWFLPMTVVSQAWLVLLGYLLIVVVAIGVRNWSKP